MIIGFRFYAPKGVCLCLLSFWKQIDIIVLIYIKCMFLTISGVLLTANKNNSKLDFKAFEALWGKGACKLKYHIYIYAYLILQKKSLCKPETSCTVLFQVTM